MNFNPFRLVSFKIKGNQRSQKKLNHVIILQCCIAFKTKNIYTINLIHKGQVLGGNFVSYNIFRK